MVGCLLNVNAGWIFRTDVLSVNPILSNWSQTDVTNSFIYDSFSQTQRLHRKITCHKIRRSLSQRWLLSLSAGGSRKEMHINWRDVSEPSPADCWQLMPTISCYRWHRVISTSSQLVNNIVAQLMVTSDPCRENSWALLLSALLWRNCKRRCYCKSKIIATFRYLLSFPCWNSLWTALPLIREFTTLSCIS